MATRTHDPESRLHQNLDTYIVRLIFRDKRERTLRGWNGFFIFASHRTRADAVSSPSDLLGSISSLTLLCERVSPSSLQDITSI